MRIKIVIGLLMSFVSWGVTAQIVEINLSVLTDELPVEITSERIAVVIDEGSAWKATARLIHANFKQMGIEAMLYLNYKEVHGGQDVMRKTLNLMDKRQIKWVIFIEQKTAKRTLTIAKFSKDHLVEVASKAWQVTGTTAIETLLQLAVKMRTMDLSYSNYLIPELPEYLFKWSLFKGTQYPSYPSQVKKAPLAISLFSQINMDGLTLNSEQMESLKAYNQQVERNNEKMKALFQDYPYKVVFMEDQTDEQFFEKRYQFVLRYAYHQGDRLRELLGYRSEPTAINYVSTVASQEHQAVKEIPKETYVFKFYIQQTISGDIYVGSAYDADHTWEEALNNFKTGMMKQFAK